VSAPLHFAPGIIVGLVTLLLVIIFYFEQEPNVVAVYGALGLVYIGLAAAIGSTVSPITYLVLWAIGASLYSIIYGLLWLFTIWLKKLREISDLHELVIAGTTAGLWKWKDMTNDEQWWSPRYYQLLGYENNEIPATLTNLTSLIHPDDRAAATKVLEDYIAGLRPDLESEYRLRTKDGQYKWFLGSGEVQFEKNTRKALRVVGSIVNIDHKKQYELALANQAALVELSPNAIITTDINYKILSWNGGAEKLYNVKAADAIGRTISDLFVTSYPHSTEEEVLNHFQMFGSWGGEVHQVTKEGRKVYAISATKLITDDAGNPTAILTVNNDLSLLNINKELNAALKMVENSTQYLEQLAYVSSHDLKSPIITLQGLLKHLASSKAIVPGYEAPFEMIKEIVEQMKSTSVALNGILQLRKNLISRDFATEKVSVAQVMKDVMEMLKGPIEASGAQINVHIEKGLQVRIHHTFLKAILFNLVSNSIKFKHPDRTPVINITADTADSNACIVVADNGSGINVARYQNKLFSIFTRFHDGVEGNGVGLHSVKMIVDFHRGEISLDSEENRGTTVTINLPLEKDNQGRPFNV
jgi:PAS domain S-box-containing protein